jgi:hypothetical protein
LPGVLQTSKHRKVASLDGSDDDDDLDDIADEEAYMNFLANGTDDKLKDTNDNWNKVHVELRKSLEKARTLDRYGIPHLSLWTDLIIEGRVSGVGEEPDWSKHLDIVKVQPVPKRLSGMEKGKGTNDLLATIMMQQEIHREEEWRKEQLQREKEESRRQMEEKARIEERKSDKEHQQMMQSMFMSVLSSNIRSPTLTQTQDVPNIFNPCSSTGPSVHAKSKDESCKENCGLAGQFSPHEISYLNSSPASYHQLKYNKWSPSSCSSCSDSPSSPSETQKQSANPQWNDFNFTQWFEQQLSAFEKREDNHTSN